MLEVRRLLSSLVQQSLPLRVRRALLYQAPQARTFQVRQVRTDQALQVQVYQVRRVQTYKAHQHPANSSQQHLVVSNRQYPVVNSQIQNSLVLRHLLGSNQAQLLLQALHPEVLLPSHYHTLQSDRRIFQEPSSAVRHASSFSPRPA